MQITKVDSLIKIAIPWKGIIPIEFLDRKIFDLISNLSTKPVTFHTNISNESEKVEKFVSGKVLKLIYLNGDLCKDNFILKRSLISQQGIALSLEPSVSFFDLELEKQLNFLIKQDNHIADYCNEIITAINKTTGIELPPFKKQRNYLRFRGVLQLSENSNFRNIFSDEFNNILDYIAKNSSKILESHPENIIHPVFSSALIPKKYEEMNVNELENIYNDIMFDINDIKLAFASPKDFALKRVTFIFENVNFEVFSESIKRLQKIFNRADVFT